MEAYLLCQQFASAVTYVGRIFYSHLKWRVIFSSGNHEVRWNLAGNT